jgi:hypothetical protein
VLGYHCYALAIRRLQNQQSAEPWQQAGSTAQLSMSPFLKVRRGCIQSTSKDCRGSIEMTTDN